MKSYINLHFYLPNFQLNGWEGASIVFVVQELEHPKYKRKGANLVTNLNITQKEALLGFERTITTLDDRKIKVARNGTSMYCKRAGLKG